MIRPLALLLLLVARPAHAQLADDPMAPPPDDAPSEGRSGWVGTKAHVSFLSDRIDRSNINLRLGYALMGGAGDASASSDRSSTTCGSRPSSRCSSSAGC